MANKPDILGISAVGGKNLFLINFLKKPVIYGENAASAVFRQKKSPDMCRGLWFLNVFCI